MNMLKILIHAHGFTTLTYKPMECLNIDFIGPFPDQGYILVIVVGDDGENIVGLIVVGLLIGVAFPNIKGTV